MTSEIAYPFQKTEQYLRKLTKAQLLVWIEGVWNDKRVLKEELEELLRSTQCERTGMDSGKCGKNIEVSSEMADAICDVDDILFHEGCLPADDRRIQEWEKLVKSAEGIVCRVTHRKRG